MEEKMGENVKPCSRCGKPIVWGYTPRNKEPHPFDARPTLGKTEDGKVIWIRVSHFVTCPGAHNKGRPKAA